MDQAEDQDEPNKSHWSNPFDITNKLYVIKSMCGTLNHMQAIPFLYWARNTVTVTEPLLNTQNGGGWFFWGNFL